MMKRYLVKLQNRLKNMRYQFLIKRLMRDGYDPAKFWKQRGAGYLDEFKQHNEETAALFKYQEEIFLNTLSDLEFDTVIEFGCGFGRMLKLIMDNFQPQRIVGIDVSPDQIKNVKKYINNSRVELQVADILKDLNFSENEFDLVYSSEVLMHIPNPDHIINQMLRISKKYILNLEYYDSSSQSLTPWCFNHNLSKIYETVPGLQVKVIPIPKLPQQITLVIKN